MDRRNMTRSEKRLAAIVLFAALSSACGGSEPQDEAIPETVTIFVPTLSRIATPVLIPVDKLRALVDRRLSGELYSESRQVTTGVAVDIVLSRRDAPITMAMVGNTLTTEVPLNVNGRVTLGLGPFSIGRPEGFDADLDVQLNTSVRLNPDWSVASDSTVAINVERAEIAVPGLELNVSTIVEEILQRNSETVAAPLDNYLADLDVRGMLEPVWEGFAEPMQLTDNPSVWLRVEPVAFKLSPAQASSGNLRFDVGMEMYIDSVVGERPGALTLGSIPPLGEAREANGAFQVAIPIVLELDEATAAISDQIIGREDEIGTWARVRWLSIELSGTDDRLRAAVRFEADTGLWFVSELAGEMAVEGRPSYDRDTQTLKVTGVDYELESDSRLAGIADRLLHRRLRDRIQEALVFPLETVIADLRGRLQSELEGISLSSYGTMNAQIETLSPESVRVDGSVVELLVRADGTMDLDLTLPVN